MVLTENNYVLNKNRYFLSWFHTQILSGYDIYLDISDFQNFIDYVTFWYESKYPNNSSSFLISDLKDISACFTYEQLMYRIDKDILDFLNCNYRNETKIRKPFYDQNGDVSYVFEEITINVYSKKDKIEGFQVVCDCSTGEVKNTEDLISKGIIDSNSINIDNLLYILNTKYNNIYNCNELKRVIQNHKIDLKLRKILIVLIGKKLLSNDDCDSDIRIKRYNSFREDFNSNMYDLRIKNDDFSNDLKVLFKH